MNGSGRRSGSPTDLGENWTHSSEGLAYEAGAEPIKAVWSVAPQNGSLYAGVQPAGLFRSDDGGDNLAARRRACRSTLRGRNGIPAAPG